VALSILAVAGLFYYKWTGSLGVLLRVQSTGALGKSPDVLLAGGALQATLRYFSLIWPALVFGTVIGSLAQAALPSRWIERVLGQKGARSILAGGVAGAPMMLCSCCVSPVSAGLYARGARLGPALAVMLGSPGLNVAALVLTFLLLPAPLAFARLAAAGLLVFGLSAAIGRRFGDVPVRPGPARVETEGAETLGALAKRFATAFARMVGITVPLVFVGVLASSWILPHVVGFSRLGTALAIAIVAFLGTLVALPTFFEIPIAILLLQLGAPPGAAVAFLVAGPIVNLPSLLVLGRQAGPRVAACVALAVWAVAALAGLVISWL